MLGRPLKQSYTQTKNLQHLQFNLDEKLHILFNLVSKLHKTFNLV